MWYNYQQQRVTYCKIYISMKSIEMDYEDDVILRTEQNKKLIKDEKKITNTFKISHVW